MKNLCWIPTLLMASALAHASTVYIDSNALDTTNNSGDPTVDLTGAVPAEPLWGAPYSGSYWISYGPTGSPADPGYFSPPDGTTVTFTTHFVLTGSITSAHLRVMADDTTSVVLNGHVISPAEMTLGSICAAADVGCLRATEGDFLSAALLPYLVDGANTLTFSVVQLGGGAFGLDFKGDIRTSDPQTPEPSTMAIFAGGLICLALLRRRR